MMFRIRAITPIHVAADELARRADRYRRLAPPGIGVDLEDLGDSAGVPRSLETAEAIRASEDLVIDRLGRTDPSRYDASLPDCVLDPGIGVGRHYPVPTFGLLQLTAHLLAGLGGTFGAVARNEAISAELARKVTVYGLGNLLAGVATLGLSVADIADDERWATAVAGSVADLDVRTVINGCSAVQVRPAFGPVILDPTATALRVLGAALDAGVLPTAARSHR